MQSSSKALEPLDWSETAGLWVSRFGIPEEVFLGYSFFKRGRMVWLYSREELPSFRFETAGLRVMSVRKGPWKPTTYALQIFGRHATRNVVDLGLDQAKLFISGDNQEVDADVEDGYVVVTLDEDVIGCGLYSRGVLISQLPKERRMARGCGDDQSRGDDQNRGDDRSC